jgi:hypothetical protein
MSSMAGVTPCQRTHEQFAFDERDAHGARTEESSMNLPKNRKLWAGAAVAAVTVALSYLIGTNLTTEEKHDLVAFLRTLVEGADFSGTSRPSNESRRQWPSTIPSLIALLRSGLARRRLLSAECRVQVTSQRRITFGVAAPEGRSIYRCHPPPRARISPPDPASWGWQQRVSCRSSEGPLRLPLRF